MKNKYLLLIAFVFVAAAQIYVPAAMILEREDILAGGKTFKLETASVDPNDPMRGKYISLMFSENVYETIDDQIYRRGEVVFVLIDENQEGFAEIVDLSLESPEENIDYVKAKISSVSTYNDTASIFIDYPFERYYMEEFKAPEAEIVYNETLSDSNKTTYAIVKIKAGDAVLEDVMIDGISIKEIANSIRAE